jgi:uncharacterized protein
VSALLESVLAGRPLTEVFVAACHAHLGLGWNHPTYGSDAASMIVTMDAVGIDVSCISSMRALGPDLIGGNAEVARVAATYPSRFIGTVVANPHLPAESLAELHRYFDTGNFGMVKVHPEFHAYPMDGPGYHGVYKFAAEAKIPVLTHSWGFGRGYDHPRLALSIAGEFPDLPLVLAHSGGTPDGLRASVEVATRFPNVYLDTATSLVYRGALEYLIDAVGADRLLFGTDTVYLDDAPQVARVVGSRIDDTTMGRVLGANLAGLLAESTAGLHADWRPADG